MDIWIRVRWFRNSAPRQIKGKKKTTKKQQQQNIAKKKMWCSIDEEKKDENLVSNYILKVEITIVIKLQGCRFER